MSREERRLLDQTLLHDYIFEWGVKKDQCCMALGYIPVYNHSYRSNCEYEMDFEHDTISIKTVRFIQKGESCLLIITGIGTTVNCCGLMPNENPFVSATKRVNYIWRICKFIGIVSVP
jgi:hypothetical protein